VADVTNDGLVLHLEDVVERDDVAIAGGRHVDVARAERRDLESSIRFTRPACWWSRMI
jgi:hypothetical protein